jgi:Putative MetA-pathway of phenol degradation
MKKITLLNFILLLVISNTRAQKIVSIQLDRPDQTECPFIVPAKHFQAEMGFVYEKVNKATTSIIAPTILWKYGINNSTELRLITESETVRTNKTINTQGISPVKIGFKTKICEEKGIIPTTSFIGHLALPKAASKDYKADFVAPLFRFVMQHTISNKLSLSYNIGAEWDGIDPEETFIYTLTAGYSFTEKLGGYIESYGFVPQIASSRHLLDGGLTYLIKNNVMLDVSGGFGLTPETQNWFAGLGFSFRLKN